MVRRLALVVALAGTLAAPAQPAGLFDTLWSWATSLLAEEPPAPPPTSDPQTPTTDDDKGYGIDPNG